MRRAARWTCLLLTLLGGAVPRAAGLTLEAVRVVREGAGPCDESYVLAHTSARAGQEFDRAQVGKDVKRLQATGRFAFVRAEVEKSGDDRLVLIFVVRNKLRVGEVRVTGADQFRQSQVEEWLGVKKGDLADEASLAVGALALRAEYRKKFFPKATVSTTLVTTDEEAGLADVVVQVEEGPRGRIRRIEFVGNQAIGAKTLLNTFRQRRWWHVFAFFRRLRYDRDEIDVGLEMIRALYLSKGYLDARVGEPDVVPAGNGHVGLRIPIQEGVPYRVGEVRIEGASLFPDAELRKVVKIGQGDLAAAPALEAAVGRLRDHYGSRGYIRSSAGYTLNVAPDAAGVADLLFSVTEGTLVKIRNIDIVGNAQTKDKVIRRELLVYPGDAFNTVKVRTSSRRLMNLGFFSYVNGVPVETDDPGQSDLVFEVEEQRTGQLMLGVGFSSIDNFVAFLELTQGNFDYTGWPTFTGAGQKLRFRAQLGDRRSDYEVSFVEPWFLDRRLSLGLDAYSREKRYLSSDYDLRQDGGAVSLGRGVWRFAKVFVKYGLEAVDVYDVGDDVSDVIKAEEGRRTKSYARVTLVNDMRDSVFIPTRGNRVSLAAGLAGGVLNFDTDLYETECRASQYVPLWFGHVLGLHATVAVVEEYDDTATVPIWDRQFLGGARTLRGFDFREAGPKDENGEPIGGRSSAMLTAEYTVPVVERVRFALFFDAGNVWEDAYFFDFSEYYSDAGVGVRFDIPGFPIRLDWAWPIQKDVYPGDDRGGEPEFQFSLGYPY
ncbi:MAG: outer membrane protein assembly factor BamA [Kiritimatiellae bacterium]|nr:outer membrane protein assembly factor BamA [Kiritimatiellia bacterium]